MLPLLQQLENSSGVFLFGTFTGGLDHLEINFILDGQDVSDKKSAKERDENSTNLAHESNSQTCKSTSAKN